jgi:hypothetical protein
MLVDCFAEPVIGRAITLRLVARLCGDAGMSGKMQPSRRFSGLPNR